jgi:hypothetical protein
VTKLRPPASFEQAITRIAGLIGWDEVSRLTGRSDRTVRDWSDPDNATLPTIAQAFALDAAYRAAGGCDTPIHSVYQLRLDTEAHTTPDSDAIRTATANAARESGEAITALILASDPGASPAHRARALLETQEATAALTRAAVALAVPEGTHALRSVEGGGKR